MAGDVDAGHQREPPQDLAAPGDGEGVLVVDAGVLAADDDVAGRQVAEGEPLEPRLRAAVDGVDPQGAEAFDVG
jgi:hypothetical protein